VASNPALRIALGGGEISAASVENSDAVMKALRAPLNALLPAYGRAAILDALLSMYVSLAIQWIGAEHAGEALRVSRKNLPRAAAIMRAGKARPQGRA
jgi:hypothetical protein